MPTQKSAATKKLQGTYRKDRAATTSDGNPLRMPPGLSAAEKLYWRQLVREMGDRLTADDGPILRGLVQSLTLRDKAHASLMDEGLFVEDERHLSRRHPAFIVWKQCEAAARQALARLGGSPADRLRLPPVESDGISELHAFLARGAARRQQQQEED